MRLVRIVGAFVALVLAVTMSSALVSPAQAAAPKHDLRAVGKEVSPNNFILKGKVTTFDGKLKLQRKVGNGSYKTIKKLKVKANNTFRTKIFQVGAKKTCFQVQAPAQGGYKKTTVKVGCIVRV